jgi:hypothetical protein
MKWLIMLLIVGMQRLNAPMVGLSALELLIGLPMTYVPTRYVSVSSSVHSWNCWLVVHYGARSGASHIFELNKVTFLKAPILIMVKYLLL